ncbi:MAG: hypothetical protein H6Q11_766 [Acidobacteria bacterium]|nr:hypothetical protein [Acidobacteriota bacterium]
MLAALVGLVVILALAYAVTRWQSEAQVSREYLDQAIEFADGEAELAERLADMLTRLEQIGRPGMATILDDLQQGTVALADGLKDAGSPPGELGSGDLYLHIAADRWRDGMTDVRRGLLALSESPEDEDGRKWLDRGLQGLRVGDSAFGGFVDLLEGVDTSELGREFPVVAFIPEGEETLYDAGSLALRLVVTPELQATMNLAVADLRLDPAPVGEQVGLPVVPLSETLLAEVTVANRGTARVAGAEVTLDLLSQDGTIYQDRQPIGPLEPGAAATASFADLPVEPGKLYEIIVTLPGGDEDPADDQMSFTFIRNGEG